MLEERGRGRTIFFSTHILSDVETLCDRVTILRQGVVVVSGALRDLVRRDVQRTDVVVSDASADFEEACRAEGHAVQRVAERLVVGVEGQAEVTELIRRALDAGLTVIEVLPRHETFEDLFMREAIDERGAASKRPPAAAGQGGRRPS
jgi:ABC-2 type transport system ATP-binding protein